MLAPNDCYHTGLVVPDMDAAAQSLTRAAGYTWTQPIEAPLSVTTDDGDREVPFKFVYSIEAPHLELIQEVPGTIWTASPHGAAHHLGYWTDDLAATAAALEHAGYRLEARPSGEELKMFAYYLDPFGVRIEIVERGLFPNWSDFLEMMKASTQ
ncbi:VOC family protein [Mycobacterium colombiense]|uniref:Bleomycin resistance protein n=1 Tax=Mycobacterium colombiense TaxID=339268 RepID=A0A1A2YIH9_9MYCO|nr:VOC family protein [Mycobacterium colombiense]OBI37067.1 bleomycin resistance protein [Mycobacterium colombiense]